jgi:hypothetical protein
MQRYLTVDVGGRYDDVYIRRYSLAGIQVLPLCWAALCLRFEKCAMCFRPFAMLLSGYFFFFRQGSSAADRLTAMLGGSN